MTQVTLHYYRGDVHRTHVIRLVHNCFLMLRGRLR